MSDTLPLFVGNIEAALECLLFVSGEPVPLSELARALGQEENAVEGALRSLQIRLAEQGSGLQILRIAGGWQMATRSEYAEVVGRLLARGSTKLSRAAMETLAIVAYRQPVTAPEIEAVRGVNVSGVLKTLLERRLILEAGRKETVGRPMLYKTSPDFLHYFNLADLSQLPALEADMPAPPPVPAEAVTDGLSLSGPETEPEDTPSLLESATLSE
jgi:segregation and condensation protein B